MPEYPSLAWVADADAALATDAHLGEALADAAFTVGYVVEGDTPIIYRLEVAAGSAHLLPGLGEASVVLRSDRTTAIAIHNGTLSAQDAIINGDLRVEGNATALIANRGALEAVNRVLESHRTAGATAP